MKFTDREGTVGVYIEIVGKRGISYRMMVEVRKLTQNALKV